MSEKRIRERERGLQTIAKISRFEPLSPRRNLDSSHVRIAGARYRKWLKSAWNRGERKGKTRPGAKNEFYITPGVLYTLVERGQDCLESWLLKKRNVKSSSLPCSSK